MGITTTQELARDAWHGYFDELSRHLGTMEATVEVVGRDVGDQIAAERLILRGITFDYKDDALVIALEAPGSGETYEHIIEHPARIQLAISDTGDVTYDIEDGAGHQTLVRLEEPPALPKPE